MVVVQAPHLLLLKPDAVPVPVQPVEECLLLAEHHEVVSLLQAVSVRCGRLFRQAVVGRHHTLKVTKKYS